MARAKVSHNIANRYSLAGIDLRRNNWLEVHAYPLLQVRIYERAAISGGAFRDQFSEDPNLPNISTAITTEMASFVAARERGVKDSRCAVQTI